MVKLLHITDLHLFTDPTHTLLGLNTNESFLAVWQKALQENAEVEGILMTGDLSQDYLKTSYERLEQLCANSPCPIYTTAGNHDDKRLLESVLVNPPFSSDKCIDFKHWRVIILNTAVSKHVEGYFEKEELEFLDKKLATRGDKHVLITFHHHVVPIHCQWLDPLGVINRDAFWEVVDRHDGIKAVLWGHIHQAFDAARGKIHCLASPSTCIQFKPQSKLFALDEQGPGYRLVTLHDDGQFESGVYRVDVEFKHDMNAQGY